MALAASPERVDQIVLFSGDGDFRSSALAEELYLGLTAHETIVQRTAIAVDAVCRWIAELQNTGGLKELNRMFAAERKAGSTMRFQIFSPRESW